MDGEVVRNRPGKYFPKTSSEVGGDECAFMANWRQRAQRLRQEAHVLYLVFKDSRTPWYAKWAAAFPIAYVFSPVQVIPNFIPVLGFLDDFLVLFAGAKLIHRLTPTDLLIECRELANLAEVCREDGLKPRIIHSAFILAAASSLLAAFATSALIAVCIYCR